jgi:hypothetical protein
MRFLEPIQLTFIPFWWTLLGDGNTNLAALELLTVHAIHRVLRVSGVVVTHEAESLRRVVRVLGDVAVYNVAIFLEALPQ